MKNLVWSRASRAEEVFKARAFASEKSFEVQKIL